MATPEWVLEKIEAMRQKGSHRLNLAGYHNKTELDEIPEEVIKLQDLEVLAIPSQKLTTIPDSILGMQKLQSLDISNNLIAVLPEFLNQLPHLKSFYFGANPISLIPDWITQREDWTGLSLGNLNLAKLPDWIAAQSNLEELWVYGNQLTTLPDWVAQLHHLKKLRLALNPFEAFPSAVCQLENLQSLHMFNCNLKAIPEGISNLKQLMELNFGGNSLGDLPDSFGKLKKLKYLDLDNNQFDQIPGCVFELSALERLSLGNYVWATMKIGNRNVIKEIPAKITRLEKLRQIDISENPIQIPPPEIVAGGIEAIREYYRQLVHGTDRLYEAKLLLVGEPGAGKTSLARKLQDSSYVLQEQEKSTQGIEISPWRFSIENGREFRVNLWDFGGQEIYHATHQYFLTRRSLYLLVADTRQEDTDFEFWLNVVELLSDGSPVLIVKNEKQDRKRELDEKLLRGHFGNLKEIVAVNLADNRGLADLKDKIRYYMRQLPHIGASLPKTWVQVRAALEHDPRSYISQEDYLRICERNGFENRSDALQLSGYLNDLGVCLHFQDDPVLKHIVILKPQWGTDAAYKVLDNPTVIANLGSFTKADLQAIWDRPEYHGMQDELLQLMMKFRLCYQIPGSRGSYMAPQLLSLTRPDYAWDEQNNLHLRYRYEFMPKGLLTQLIVALHKRIAEHKLVWRSGVVLEDPRTRARAEVIEYYSKREIHIRVSGVQKKDLLAVVSYEMDAIHASFPSLKYDTLIPCNCSGCKTAASPHFYTMETLSHFVQQRQQLIQCQRSFQMVDVFGLIDDVLSQPPKESSGELGDAGRALFGSVKNLYLQIAETIDQRSIRAGGAYIGGDANVGGDLVGRDQQKITFPQVYEMIQGSAAVKTEDKTRLKETVEDIESELRDCGEEPNEGFLTRRFKNIVRLAPDILDVILAAATNPLSGFSEAARKIARRAAEQAKGKQVS